MERDNVLEIYNTSMSDSRQIMTSILALLAQQETTIQTIINARNAVPPIQPFWQSRRARARRETTLPVLPTPAPVPAPVSTSTQPLPGIDSSLNVVEDLLFSQVTENDRYGMCPITYEEFDGESEITRIRYCGHYFSRQAITRWLTTNSSCPICRHNTRPNNIVPPPPPPPDTTLIDNMIGILSNELNSENSLAAFNSLVFHFDIAENLD